MTNEGPDSPYDDDAADPDDATDGLLDVYQNRNIANIPAVAVRAQSSTSDRSISDLDERPPEIEVLDDPPP